MSSEILERQVEKEYLNKFSKLDPQDEYFDAEKIHGKFRKKKDFNANFSIKKSRQKKHRKKPMKDIEQKTKDAKNNPKTKSIIEFDTLLSCSIKCLAVKKNKTIKPKTQFLIEKC